MNLNHQLTPSFKLGEFFTSPGSLDYFAGLHEQEKLHVIDNITALANRLQVVRDLIGCPITITSGLRSPARNASIGGAEKSSHTDGRGCDFSVPWPNEARLEQLLKTWNGGFKFYTDDHHFHVDIGAKRRW